jgi:hypothetical protein
MGEKGNAYRVLKGKGSGSWPLGITKHRKENNIKTDLKEIRRRE